MEERKMTERRIKAFGEYLAREEKSPATQEKYLRDVRAFAAWAGQRQVTKEATVAYKAFLQEKGYALRSVNAMLAALNSFLAFAGWGDCRVKALRCQRQTYCAEEKELTKEEYLRLLAAARKKQQLHLILQTICGTGIRVSELKYFTVEAAERGDVTVRCKNKTRTILIPGRLRRRLLEHAKARGIKTGPVFLSSNGKPVDRSSVWAQMKRLCLAAGVTAAKVFPHNLRKLFARTFYAMEKDIAKLADILGHGSIETTRIYIMTTGTEHRRKMERLGLVL